MIGVILFFYSWNNMQAYLNWPHRMIPIERHFIIGNAPNTGLEGSLARTGPRAGDLHGRLSTPKLNCWRLRHPSQARLMLSRVAAVEGVEMHHDRGNKPPQGFKKHCATQCQNRLYVQEKKLGQRVS